MATSFEPTIQSVAIEAFRGFRDRQEIELAASVVLISGPNGSGKTSFFDALQWCLLGSLKRLADLRARPNVEHIVNQYRLSERAAVEVRLLVGTRELTVRRTGDSRSSSLEFAEFGKAAVFGDEAAKKLSEALMPGGELTLDMALTTSGMMQQDVMRAVLEAKPADRYRHISSVLGLSALEDFEAATKESAAAAKSRADSARAERDSLVESLATARARLDEAEERINSGPQLDALRSEIASMIRGRPESLTLDGEIGFATAESTRAVALELADLIARMEAFDAGWTRAQSLRPSSSEPTDDQHAIATSNQDVAREASTAASELLGQVRERLEVARAASDDMARLAVVAIPMLTETCPVCGQTIDASAIERTLRARATDTGVLLSLEGEVSQALDRVDQANATVNNAENTVRELEALRAQWTVYRQASLASVQRASEAAVSTGTVRATGADTESLSRVVIDIVTFLKTLRQKVLDLLEAFSRADRGAVERASSEVESFDSAVRMRSSRLEQESARALLLKALADATVAARVEVTEKRFRAVQPLVADIFSRLDPHPAFKTIEFELDTYYRRGTTSPLVRDLVEGISADPLLVFSTSQANIAALSYFLAMGWTAAEKGLPFVLLDDPVQSMDDINVLGFADLCRHIRLGRQLIISTHERRLASLLERKLAPRVADESTAVVEFLGWDRSGPHVDVRRVPSQDVAVVTVVKAAS